jgi:hypothetical protein
VLLLCAPPGGDRIAAVHTAGHRAKFLLDFVELPQRDCEQAIGAQRNSLIELQLSFEVFPAQTE